MIARATVVEYHVTVDRGLGWPLVLFAGAIAIVVLAMLFYILRRRK